MKGRFRAAPAAVRAGRRNEWRPLGLGLGLGVRVGVRSGLGRVRVRPDTHRARRSLARSIGRRLSARRCVERADEAEARERERAGTRRSARWRVQEHTRDRHGRRCRRLRAGRKSTTQNISACAPRRRDHPGGGSEARARPSAERAAGEERCWAPGISTQLTLTPRAAVPAARSGVRSALDGDVHPMTGAWSSCSPPCRAPIQR